jgi:hypothetical protein
MCSFGEKCPFGERCSFGEGCSLEGQQLIGERINACGGFGSDGRTTYGIPTKEGVWVRCGCWFGALKDFRERVQSVYPAQSHTISTEYQLLADLFEARWLREMKEDE